MLGFLFACLFVGLSQGEARAMTPVTAVVFAVPLYDTTATMIGGRMWLAKSPLSADQLAPAPPVASDAGFTRCPGAWRRLGLQLLLGYRSRWLVLLGS